MGLEIVGVRKMMGPNESWKLKCWDQMLRPNENVGKMLEIEIEMMFSEIITVL